jgi:hypothetical protein
MHKNESSVIHQGYYHFLLSQHNRISRSWNELAHALRLKNVHLVFVNKLKKRNSSYLFVMAQSVKLVVNGTPVSASV